MRVLIEHTLERVEDIKEKYAFKEGGDRRSGREIISTARKKYRYRNSDRESWRSTKKKFIVVSRDRFAEKSLSISRLEIGSSFPSICLERLTDDHGVRR